MSMNQYNYFILEQYLFHRFLQVTICDAYIALQALLHGLNLLRSVVLWLLFFEERVWQFDGLLKTYGH